MKAIRRSVLVKVTQKDRDAMAVTKSGLIMATDWQPMAHYTCSGTVLSVGSDIKLIEEGDILLFHHTVQHNSIRLLEFNIETGDEIWCVRNEPGSTEIYGYIRDGVLYPAPGSVVCYPDEIKEGEEFDIKPGETIATPRIIQNTRKHFKATVAHIHPDDKHPIKVGNLICCEPLAHYVITYKAQDLWFIKISDILFTFTSKVRIKVLEHIRAKDEQTAKMKDWTIIQ